MKKRSDESSSTKPPQPVDSIVRARAHVRYVGFETINSGRRLRFRVKSHGHESADVTFDIGDAVFIGTPGISIQDAAPMAYERLVELLSTDGTPESDKLDLTDVDIARYLDRHVSSQKRTYSLTDERRQSDIAA
jgi:hypothetical protein